MGAYQVGKANHTKSQITFHILPEIVGLFSTLFPTDLMKVMGEK